MYVCCQHNCGKLLAWGYIILKYCIVLFLPLDPGESGGQEASLFSGDSLCFAFALPGVSVGLEGVLEPRLAVPPPPPPPPPPPWWFCGRVGLL